MTPRANGIEVHLIDGTYELFRHFFALPSSKDANGREIAAVRGVLNLVMSLIDRGATHVGVATDHVIESFRNDLYTGYKTGEGIAPALFSQFPILEQALATMGVLVWPMVEFEADDALAAAADKAGRDKRVSRVLIHTPDKDLAQCVVDKRVVQVIRKPECERDEAAVIEKFGVSPQSIPDYLALVGDSADGFPGITGWGAKAAAAVLSRYAHLEAIPKDYRRWHPSIARARGLSETLFGAWDDALLFRKLATLRRDVPVFRDIEELRWKSASPAFESLAIELKVADLARKARAVADSRNL